MHGRFLGALALSVGLAGCVSNPNAMVFGTNTTFGVSAGAGATATPSIVVGYERQEAVLMPLVAATGSNGDKITSCQVEPVTTSTEAHDHPCILVGKGVTSTGAESDSLSVLASFGTKGNTSVNGKDPAVSGKITQYFATGLAARRIAETSGAAAVATGPAAELSASGWTEAEKNAEIEGRVSGREAVAKRIETADADFRSLLSLMNDAAGTTRFTTACPDTLPKMTATECATKLRQKGVLSSLNADQLKRASEVKKL